MKRIILTTGGTGGHIFPALAVAEELKLKGDVQLLFVGSDYGPEKKLVSNAGIEFVGLPVRGILGRGRQSIVAAYAMLKSYFKAIGIIKNFKPNCVLGFGSYAAFAPIMAAQSLGIKTFVHEQNAVAGVSNKVQGHFAKKIFLGMPETKGFKAEKCIVTGNPVRNAIAKIASNKHEFSGKRLLVVGGSQGAKALNDVIIKNLEIFNAAGISVRHQCGAKDYDRVHAAYVSAGASTTQLSAFIDDMANEYDLADLVLCRSGASTVAEIICAGRPAIFVPFPHATHDHQTHNAKQLVEHEAAIMFAENEMYEADILGSILSLLNDAHRLENMAKSAKNLDLGNAAQNIVRNLVL